MAQALPSQTVAPGCLVKLEEEIASDRLATENPGAAPGMSPLVITSAGHQTVNPNPRHKAVLLRVRKRGIT